MTLNIDIENTTRIEDTHKHHKKHWRIIYEVIQQEFYDKTDILPEMFKNNCKNNANETLI